MVTTVKKGTDIEPAPMVKLVLIVRDMQHIKTCVLDAVSDPFVASKNRMTRKKVASTTFNIINY